jgi:hypothetical protein
MNVDFGQLTEEAAFGMGGQLLAQLEEARAAVDQAQRRATGIRKMIDGLVEMFPAVEDLLPDDLDDDEDPRPRGAEAVRRALANRKGDWFTVSSVVSLLDKHGWLPTSSNPANAVRSALVRLYDAEVIAKDRGPSGAVIYSYPVPEYGDEEPF